MDWSIDTLINRWTNEEWIERWTDIKGGLIDGQAEGWIDRLTDKG